MFINHEKNNYKLKPLKTVHIDSQVFDMLCIRHVCRNRVTSSAAHWDQLESSNRRYFWMHKTIPAVTPLLTLISTRAVGCLF